jgi:hypothetical protein
MSPSSKSLINREHPEITSPTSLAWTGDEMPPPLTDNKKLSSLVTVEREPAPSFQELSLRDVIPIEIRINNLTVALPAKQPKQRNGTSAYFEGFFNSQAVQSDPETAVVPPPKEDSRWYLC